MWIVRCSSDAWWIQYHIHQQCHQGPRIWALRYVGLIELWNRIDETAVYQLYIVKSSRGFGRIQQDLAGLWNPVHWSMASGWTSISYHVMRPLCHQHKSCCVQCHLCCGWRINKQSETRISTVINHSAFWIAVKNSEVNILHTGRTDLYTTRCSCIHFKKYTPTTDGAIALPIPVHDPIVPDIALPLIVPLVVEMCPDEVFVPLVEMFPTAVIVPFVVMLPMADFANCWFQVSEEISVQIEMPFWTLRKASIYTSSWNNIPPGWASM